MVVIQKQAHTMKNVEEERIIIRLREIEVGVRPTQTTVPFI